MTLQSLDNLTSHPPLALLLLSKKDMTDPMKAHGTKQAQVLILHTLQLC